eukprot:Blabericola_migrator_1__10897@NODE_6291_length_566_cov_4_649299_g4257_i0_p1_GENE_NODE_6291_length_566_cov_4_649299_g4257_i0NODE_6291_length_566_cov_4_649299_g4257_i0_p1_ORF_typecomplete_len117_score9_98_NODE_6291_length_566_cov_4_649299_g4257_i032382
MKPEHSFCEHITRLGFNIDSASHRLYRYYKPMASLKLVQTNQFWRTRRSHTQSLQHCDPSLADPLTLNHEPHPWLEGTNLASSQSSIPQKPLDANAHCEGAPSRGNTAYAHLCHLL